MESKRSKDGIFLSSRHPSVPVACVSLRTNRTRQEEAGEERVSPVWC